MASGQQLRTLLEAPTGRRNLPSDPLSEAIFAGPWVGEFGWEIGDWQARVRGAAGGRPIIVGTRRSRAALYMDFAAGFVYVPESIETCGRRCAEPIPTKIKDLFNSADHRMVPSGRPRGRRVFTKYGRPSDALRYDVLIHARWTPKSKLGRSSLERNWPGVKWCELAERFTGRVGSIGTIQEAIAPAGDDLRGIPLADLMDIMASSRVIIGPSSGPMHLAALCGLPSIVWCNPAGRAMGTSTADRLRHNWNPFETPVKIVAETNPAPSTIAKHLP